MWAFYTVSDSIGALFRLGNFVISLFSGPSSFGLHCLTLTLPAVRLFRSRTFAGSPSQETR